MVLGAHWGAGGGYYATSWVGLNSGTTHSAVNGKDVIKTYAGKCAQSRDVETVLLVNSMDKAV